MNETARPILIFRVIVFGLTVFYMGETLTDMHAGEFGWQFRFLTIWALFGSGLSAWFMLQRSRGKTTKRHEIWAGVMVVVNVMVVYLYWSIFLNDPSSFYEDGIRLVPLWQEYYLHGIGPLLQWIDALFILGVFRRGALTVAATAVLTLVYSIWIEFIVQPLNATPVGSVTSGLPYRFLNNLDFAERISFYATNVCSALALGLILWGVHAVLRRIRRA